MSVQFGQQIPDLDNGTLRTEFENYIIGIKVYIVIINWLTEHNDRYELSQPIIYLKYLFPY